MDEEEAQPQEQKAVEYRSFAPSNGCTCGASHRPYTDVPTLLCCMNKAVAYFSNKQSKGEVCAPSAGKFGALIGWLNEAYSKETRKAIFYALFGVDSANELTACQKAALLAASGISKESEDAPWLPKQEFVDEMDALVFAIKNAGD